MLYIFLVIIFFILFIDVGLVVEREYKTDLYLLIAFIKIKIPAKRLTKVLDKVSSYSLKELFYEIKKNIKISGVIRKIMKGTSIDYFKIVKYDDINNIDLFRPLFTENIYSFLSSYVNENFYIVKKKEFLYFPYTQKKLIVRIKMRINIFKMITILVREGFKSLGGKIYEQSRRVFKNKSWWGKYIS